MESPSCTPTREERRLRVLTMTHKNRDNAYRIDDKVPHLGAGLCFNIKNSNLAYSLTTQVKCSHDCQRYGCAGFGVGKGMMMSFQVEAAGGGHGMQLVVGKRLAEMAAGRY